MRISVELLIIVIFIIPSKGEPIPENVNTAIVNTEFGPVEGITVPSLNGKLVDVFLGIPYASVRSRFSPPRDPEPWTETVAAKTIPNVCYQGILNAYKHRSEAFWLTDLPESEDCLKLNVWTLNQRDEDMAVMVWIHGGGFQTGTSNADLYDGRTLASEEEVVVVSMNYRLNSFGFLYLDHPDAPGNVGLMDQTSALVWVKNNIRRFGGDPKRVTIFGESAGGSSVQHHFVLPTSRGLFQRGVIQSGAPDPSWSSKSRRQAFEDSLGLATRLGCAENSTNDIAEVIRCMNAKEPGEIQAVQDKDKFFPVADGLYLPSTPKVLIKQRKFSKRNELLIGSTTEDGTFLLNTYLPEKNWTEDTQYSKEDTKLVIGKMTGVSSDRLANAVLFHYVDETHSKAEDFRTVLNRLLADDCLCSDIAVSDSFTTNGNKVYLYRFSQRPSASLKPKWTGALHGDELPFLFGVPLHPEKGFSPEEVEFSRNIMRHWTNFAKYGDPNIKSDESVYWPRYTVRDKPAMILTTSAGVTRGDRLRECAFWKYVFPLLKTA